MLEEQLERVRGETRRVREAVGRAKEVVETMGKEVQGGVGRGGGSEQLRESLNHGSRKEELMEKRIWEILEKDTGRLQRP